MTRYIKTVIHSWTTSRYRIYFDYAAAAGLSISERVRSRRSIFGAKGFPRHGTPRTEAAAVITHTCFDRRIVLYTRIWNIIIAILGRDGRIIVCVLQSRCAAAQAMGKSSRLHVMLINYEKKGSEKKQRYKIRRRNLSNTLKNNQGRVWAKFEGGTLKVADSGAWDRPRVIYAVAGDHWSVSLPRADRASSCKQRWALFR